MTFKFIIIFLALLNGLWMTFDGFHVLVKGKYFGPEKPGPWSRALSAIGLDPFRMGPVFIFIGFIWLLFVFGLIAGYAWYGLTGIAVCILTLWYFPFGTLISVITLLWLVIHSA